MQTVITFNVDIMSLFNVDVNSNWVHMVLIWQITGTISLPYRIVILLQLIVCVLILCFQPKGGAVSRLLYLLYRWDILCFFMLYNFIAKC